uniref:Uncharacterized protein n=1 Tax=Anguilla anguilla TaxID=7936 RepID=A0A0E9QFW1_ANGAN
MLRFLFPFESKTLALLVHSRRIFFLLEPTCAFLFLKPGSCFFP